MHARVRAIKRGRTASPDRCPALGKKVAENRPMAPRFVFAIATDREMSMVRQGGEQIERAPGGGLVHLGTE